MIVDCRKCRHFESMESIREKAVSGDKEYEEIMEYIVWYECRNAVNVLGYCWRYRRPVRYYRGRCRGFEKQYSPPAKNPITYYLSNR